MSVAQINDFITCNQHWNQFNQLLKPLAPSDYQKSHFFQGILESLVDGILVVTTQGKIIHSNAQATSLCQQLTHATDLPNNIPEEIWRICQALMEGDEFFVQQQMVIESEVMTCQSTPLRLRARWLDSLEAILITIEDRYQSLENLALAEIHQYGFTSREAEVWSLKRTNHSNKDIATKLYISENTVKKHVKNINLKRQAAA